jgi:hypothetical protein
MRPILSAALVASCFGAAFAACSSSSDDALGPPDVSDAAVDATSISADGAPSDVGAPSDAGAASDAPAACTSIFCEDFESGGFDAGLWSTNVGYAADTTMQIETDRVHSGKYAARAHLDMAGGFAFLKRMTPPSLTTDAWGRAYFYIDEDQAMGHTGLAHFGQLEIGFSGDLVQLTYYPTSGENPRGYQDAAVPLERWSCFEWHVSTSTPDITLYIDGTLVATYAPYQADATVPAFDTFELGLETHGAGSKAYENVVDDVAIDSNRIGCF